jgi:tetratricopeptide (TPR) repeat protein
MPQHTKRRFRRKDLRQPDEFETLTAQALVWAEEHRQLLLGLLGAAVAVAVVVLIVARVNASRNASAGDAFQRARASFEAGRFAEASESFASAARDYPRAPFGKLATLYRGHALARQNDAVGAAVAYEEYLATGPVAYLKQEALVGLARAKESAGEAAAALLRYTEAGGSEGPYRTDALLNAARLHEAAGQADQARGIYGRLLKESPDPELRGLLLSKLPPGTDAATTAVSAAEP